MQFDPNNPSYLNYPMPQPDPAHFNRAIPTNQPKVPQTPRKNNQQTQVAKLENLFRETNFFK